MESNLVEYAGKLFSETLEVLRNRSKYEGVMERTVVLFNLTTGYNLTTKDGYMFLSLMKLQRMLKDGDRDSLIDLLNYLILCENEHLKNDV